MHYVTHTHQMNQNLISIPFSRLIKTTLTVTIKTNVNCRIGVFSITSVT